MSECSDAERVWYPQRLVCYATREREAAVALYSQLHEDRPYHDGLFRTWSEKRTRSHPYRYDDGVSIIVTDYDMNPDDQFLRAGAGGFFSG